MPYVIENFSNSLVSLNNVTRDGKRITLPAKSTSDVIEDNALAGKADQVLNQFKDKIKIKRLNEKEYNELKRKAASEDDKLKVEEAEKKAAEEKLQKEEADKKAAEEKLKKEEAEKKAVADKKKKEEDEKKASEEKKKKEEDEKKTAEPKK